MNQIIINTNITHLLEVPLLLPNLLSNCLAELEEYSLEYSKRLTLDYLTA